MTSRILGIKGAISVTYNIRNNKKFIWPRQLFRIFKIGN